MPKRPVAARQAGRETFSVHVIARPLIQASQAVRTMQRRLFPAAIFSIQGQGLPPLVRKSL